MARRILVVDDNPAIHKDFRKLLCPSRSHGTDLSKTEAFLFGDEPPTQPEWDFEVDSAFQGQEALEIVTRMVRLGRPYAMAFVDMRMPPGWDGVETIRRLWEVEADLEVVICSAYSDYSWNEVISKLARPSVRLLQKPFESREALELAWKLTSRWLGRSR